MPSLLEYTFHSFTSLPEEDFPHAEHGFVSKLDAYEWTGLREELARKSEFSRALTTSGYRVWTHTTPSQTPLTSPQESTERRMTLHGNDPVSFARTLVRARYGTYPLYASRIATQDPSAALRLLV